MFKHCPQIQLGETAINHALDQVRTDFQFPFPPLWLVLHYCVPALYSQITDAKRPTNRILLEIGGRGKGPLEEGTREIGREVRD
jgi:hypothetical protein